MSPGVVLIVVVVYAQTGQQGPGKGWIVVFVVQLLGDCRFPSLCSVRFLLLVIFGLLMLSLFRGCCGLSRSRSRRWSSGLSFSSVLGRDRKEGVGDKQLALVLLDVDDPACLSLQLPQTDSLSLPCTDRHWYFKRIAASLGRGRL